MPESLYGQILAALASGEAVASATITGTRGSTPLEAGAKMLVRRSGAIVGTVGGGCGEAEVWRAALRVIESGEPQLVFVDLTGEISMDSASVCGGTMDVLVELWHGQGGEHGDEDVRVARMLVERLKARMPSILATVVSSYVGAPCRAGDRALLGPEGLLSGGSSIIGVMREWLSAQAAEVLAGGSYAVVEYRSAPNLAAPSIRVALEPVSQPPLLAIMGAGHIAQPLAQLGKMLGFAVAVLDDRASFANSERFPDADIVLATEFVSGIRGLPIDEGSYVVLITRGHQHDVECLKQVIGTDAAYIGMIGSRRRVRAVFELLRQEGFEIDRLHRVHAPIGLDIGAETAAEIAVSIAAEIVNVRRKGRSTSLSDATRRPTVAYTTPQ